MVRSATIENYSDGPLRTIPGLSEWTIENYSDPLRWTIENYSHRLVFMDKITWF